MHLPTASRPPGSGLSGAGGVGAGTARANPSLDKEARPSNSTKFRPMVAHFGRSVKEHAPRQEAGRQDHGCADPPLIDHQDAAGRGEADEDALEPSRGWERERSLGGVLMALHVDDHRATGPLAGRAGFGAFPHLRIGVRLALGGARPADLGRQARLPHYRPGRPGHCLRGLGRVHPSARRPSRTRRRPREILRGPASRGDDVEHPDRPVDKVVPELVAVAEPLV